jgi:hypothetical protein
MANIRGAVVIKKILNGPYAVRSKGYCLLDVCGERVTITVTTSDAQSSVSNDMS